MNAPVIAEFGQCADSKAPDAEQSGKKPKGRIAAHLINSFYSVHCCPEKSMVIQLKITYVCTREINEVFSCICKVEVTCVLYLKS